MGFITTKSSFVGKCLLPFPTILTWRCWEDVASKIFEWQKNLFEQNPPGSEGSFQKTWTFMSQFGCIFHQKTSGDSVGQPEKLNQLEFPRTSTIWQHLNSAALFHRVRAQLPLRWWPIHNDHVTRPRLRFFKTEDTGERNGRFFCCFLKIPEFFCSLSLCGFISSKCLMCFFQRFLVYLCVGHVKVVLATSDLHDFHYWGYSWKWRAVVEREAWNSWKIIEMKCLSDIVFFGNTQWLFWHPEAMERWSYQNECESRAQCRHVPHVPKCWICLRRLRILT